eukprot:SAG31_NODE_30482_length_380_cov_1.277580_1_plen_49_part_01
MAEPVGEPEATEEGVAGAESSRSTCFKTGCATKDTLDLLQRQLSVRFYE